MPALSSQPHGSVHPTGPGWRLASTLPGTTWVVSDAPWLSKPVKEGVTLILLLLLLIVIVFGLGFIVKGLFWLALILLALWLLGWLIRPAGGRWYYW